MNNYGQGLARKRKRNNHRYIDPDRPEVKISTFGSLDQYKRGRIIDASITGFMCAMDPRFQKMTFGGTGETRVNRLGEHSLSKSLYTVSNNSPRSVYTDTKLITMVMLVDGKNHQVHGRVLNIFSKDIDGVEMSCLGAYLITESMSEEAKRMWARYIDRLAADGSNEAQWQRY